MIEARNGREAVELARERCPALVFMDIQMPVMDGLTATRMMRRIEELCEVVIVAFSAFASGDNQLRHVVLNPSQDCCMRDIKTALGHDLDQVSIAEFVSDVPADTENNDRSVEVAAMKQGR